MCLNIDVLLLQFQYSNIIRNMFNIFSLPVAVHSSQIKIKCNSCIIISYIHVLHA